MAGEPQRGSHRYIPPPSTVGQGNSSLPALAQLCRRRHLQVLRIVSCRVAPGSVIVGGSLLFSAMSTTTASPSITSSVLAKTGAWGIRVRLMRRFMHRTGTGQRDHAEHDMAVAVGHTLARLGEQWVTPTVGTPSAAPPKAGA